MDIVMAYGTNNSGKCSLEQESMESQGDNDLAEIKMMKVALNFCVLFRLNAIRTLIRRS